MDPSTQKLLDRTRQRREQLNQELGLSQTVTPAKITPTKRKSSNESDKICENSRETPSKKSSFNENDDNSSKKTNGRNFYPLEELEQLAKQSVAEVHKSPEDYKKEFASSRTPSAPVPLNVASEHHDSVAPEARKARLAALAAKIGSYEDEIVPHTPSSSTETVSKKANSIPAPNSSSSARNHSESSECNTKIITPTNSCSTANDSETNFSPDCGVESFFVRKTSTPDINTTKSGSEIVKNEQQTVKNDSQTNKSEPQTSHEMKRPAPQRPTLAKLDPAGKVSAMANKWENQIQSDVQSKNDAKSAPVVKSVAKPAKPLMPLPPPAPPSAAFRATKAKIATNLQYVNRPGVSPKRERESSEPKDVNKLRSRWEIASKCGIALQPEQSLSQYDVVTATAIKMFQPNRVVPVKKDLKENIDHSDSAVYSTRLELQVAPSNKISSSNIVEKNKIVEDKCDTKTESSYEADSSDSEFGDSAELDACLEEAINSATLAAAQKSPRTPVQAKPPHVPAANVDQDAPLLYTVSMYRRMQKELSTDGTPIKTVVKPPSSPRRRKASESAQNSEKNAGVYERKVKGLNDAITVQQEQIYQASRALRYCRDMEEFRGSTEEVDAHKVLLVAGEKRKAFQQELDRLNEMRKQRKPLESDDPLGTLTFQYISLSLKREFVNDRINSMGEYVYYFICILKYRDQLLTTQVVDSDKAVREGGRIEFPNYFHFNSLPHDFNVDVNVFALQAKREELSQEQKYHLKGATIKHKQRPNSAVMSTSAVSLGGPGCVLDTNFRLIGQVNLTLGSVTRQKFALQGFLMVAPLEPGIHLKMRCCADSVGTVEEKGFLSVYEEVSHLGSWHRRWCTLKDGVLHFWRYPDEEQTKEPVLSVDLVHCVTRSIELVPKDVCTRPNSFVLDIQGDNLTEVKPHLFSADNKEEYLGWCEKLNQALHNLRLWNVESFVL